MDASPPVDLLSPARPATPAGKTRQQIEVAAKQFEAAFIAQMLGAMFQGGETSAPFGGGAGEDAFKSFLTDAFAKSMAKSGGVGLSKDLARERLKMQGLS